MPFKDKIQPYVKKYIDSQGEARGKALEKLSALVRKTVPDFSTARLVKLLQGYRPRDKELDALGAALGVSPARFIDVPDSFTPDENRRKIRVVLKRIDKLHLTDEFENYVANQPRRATPNGECDLLNFDEINELLSYFLKDKEGEVDIW